MNTSTLRDENRSATNTTELAARARLAFEQKQTRECLTLIRQLLEIDEHHAEARALQDAVREDMQRDFEDAKTLLEDARKREDGHKYRKAAEIILLKILYLDPTFTEAKTLLASIKGAPVHHSSVSTSQETTRWRQADDDLGFTARPEPVEQLPESSGRRVPLILVLPVFILLVAGFFYYRSAAPASPAEPATAATSPATEINSRIVPPVSPTASLESTLLPDNVVNLTNENTIDSNPPAAPVPSPDTAEPAKLPVVPPPPVTPPTGSIAVSSAVPAEIYLKDKRLGTTPVTLQLAAGRYTLEYRAGDLRTVMTHEVKARQTTTAVVAFETTVQINARPWAQVYLDGGTRQALGQTPLSSVRVPVGSVLVFENPNFPPKSHRVAETDSTIQVIFP